MTNSNLRALAAGLLCLLAGCGDDTGDGGAGASGGGATGGSGAMGGSGATGGSGGDDDAGTAEYAYSACPKAERVGGFKVSSFEANAAMPKPYSSVVGEVKDGVVPANVPDPVTTLGSCTLVRGRNLACAPECEVGTTCDPDGTCIPEPRNQDVGTVTINGLKDAVSMEARAVSLNYDAAGTHQFDEGAAITLSATGGTLSPFDLVAEGVGLLALAGDPVTIPSATPVTVSWTPPAQPGRSHVLATLNIALHGGDPVRIECDAPDTGTLEIPAALIDELLSYAFSGFPRLDLVRQTAGSVDLDVGCVDLTVAAHATVDVEIDGFTSCNDELPCPMGQVCTVDLFCE
jgi:hypothetical protein